MISIRIYAVFFVILVYTLNGVKATPRNPKFYLVFPILNNNVVESRKQFIQLLRDPHLQFSVVYQHLKEHRFHRNYSKNYIRINIDKKFNPFLIEPFLTAGSVNSQDKV